MEQYNKQKFNLFLYLYFWQTDKTTKQFLYFCFYILLFFFCFLLTKQNNKKNKKKRVC